MAEDVLIRVQYEGKDTANQLKAVAQLVENIGASVQRSAASANFGNFNVQITNINNTIRSYTTTVRGATTATQPLGISVNTVKNAIAGMQAEIEANRARIAAWRSQMLQAGNPVAAVDREVKRLESDLNKAANRVQNFTDKLNAGARPTQAFGIAIGIVGQQLNRAIPQANQFAEANKRIAESVENVRNRSSRFMQMFSTGIFSLVGQSIGQVGQFVQQNVSQPIIDLGTFAVQSATRIDDLKSTLTGLTGSPAAAEAQLLHLRQLANDSVGVTATMAAQYYSVFKQLEGATDLGIDRITKALGRLNALNKLSQDFGQNLVQIFSQGFEEQDIKQAIGNVPAFRNILKTAFGTDDNKRLKELKDSGKLTAEQFLQQISETIEKDPKYANVVERFSLRWEKAMDRIAFALAPLGNLILSVVEPAIQPVTNFIEFLSRSFEGLSPTVKTIILSFGAFLAAAGSLIGTVAAGVAAFVAIKAAIAAVGIPLAIIGVALAAVTAAIGVLYLAWTNNWGNIQGKTSQVVDALISYFNQIREWWNQNGESIIASAQEIWTNVQEGAKRLFEALFELFGDWIESIRRGLTVIYDFWQRHQASISAIVSAGWNFIKTYIGAILNYIVGLIKIFDGVMTLNWRKIFDGLSLIHKAFWDVIRSMFFTQSKIIAEILKTLVRELAGLKGDAEITGWTIAKALINGMLSVLTAPGALVYQIVKKLIIGETVDQLKGQVESAIEATKPAPTTFTLEDLYKKLGIPLSSPRDAAGGGADEEKSSFAGGAGGESEKDKRKREKAERDAAAEEKSARDFALNILRKTSDVRNEQLETEKKQLEALIQDEQSSLKLADIKEKLVDIVNRQWKIERDNQIEQMKALNLSKKLQILANQVVVDERAGVDTTKARGALAAEVNKSPVNQRDELRDRAAKLIDIQVKFYKSFDEQRQIINDLDTKISRKTSEILEKRLSDKRKTDEAIADAENTLANARIAISEAAERRITENTRREVEERHKTYEDAEKEDLDREEKKLRERVRNAVRIRDEELKQAKERGDVVETKTGAWGIVEVISTSSRELAKAEADLMKLLDDQANFTILRQQRLSDARKKDLARARADSEAIAGLNDDLEKNEIEREERRIERLKEEAEARGQNVTNRRDIIEAELALEQRKENFEHEQHLRSLQRKRDEVVADGGRLEEIKLIDKLIEDEKRRHQNTLDEIQRKKDKAAPVSATGALFAGDTIFAGLSNLSTYMDQLVDKWLTISQRATAGGNSWKNVFNSVRAAGALMTGAIVRGLNAQLSAFIQTGKFSLTALRKQIADELKVRAIQMGIDAAWHLIKGIYYASNPVTAWKAPREFAAAKSLAGLAALAGGAGALLGIGTGDAAQGQANSEADRRNGVVSRDEFNPRNAGIYKFQSEVVLRVENIVRTDEGRIVRTLVENVNNNGAVRRLFIGSGDPYASY